MGQQRPVDIGKALPPNIAIFIVTRYHYGLHINIVIAYICTFDAMLAVGALSPPLPRLYAHAASSAIVAPDHNTPPYRVQLLGQRHPTAYSCSSTTRCLVTPPPPHAATSGARHPPQYSQSSPNGRSISRPPDGEDEVGRRVDLILSGEDLHRGPPADGPPSPARRPTSSSSARTSGGRPSTSSPASKDLRRPTLRFLACEDVQRLTLVLRAPANLVLAGEDLQRPALRSSPARTSLAATPSRRASRAHAAAPPPQRGHAEVPPPLPASCRAARHLLSTPRTANGLPAPSNKCSPLCWRGGVNSNEKRNNVVREMLFSCCCRK